MSVDRPSAALENAPDHAPGTGAKEMDDYTAFYRAEFRPVARTVYLIVHDTAKADDLTQEAFVQLLQHWKKVSRYERPGAWVRRVAIRLATRHLRRERMRAVLDATTNPRRWPARPTWTCCGRSPAPPEPARRHRALDFQDPPVAEIVDLLGCTESAAKVWLHRGGHRLAELLTEEVTEHVS